MEFIVFLCIFAGETLLLNPKTVNAYILDGEDIMPAIVDGVYTATADKQNAKLVVKFSGESRVEIGDANSDKHVDARDVKAITDYMIGNGPEKFSTKAADMNNDTLFNIADIIQIVNQILSKE